MLVSFTSTLPPKQISPAHFSAGGCTLLQGHHLYLDLQHSQILQQQMQEGMWT